VLNRIYVDKLYEDEDYTHNFTKIRLQCSICLQDRVPRNCKIWKNTASLWRHVKRDHVGSSLPSEIEEIKKSLRHISKAVKQGMIPTR